MSERLPYPREPGKDEAGVRGSVMEMLQLLRLVFFPRNGTGLYQRVAELEERVRKLEQAP